MHKTNCWIITQDIAGFTSLSEKLAKKGKEGAELLERILNNFFKRAEEEIERKKGKIFKLAGDAYFAIIKGTKSKEEIQSLGEKLLNLSSLKKWNIKSRFIAIKGNIEYDFLNLNKNHFDLIIRGLPVNELMVFEEKTPAGEIFVSLMDKYSRNYELPEFPYKRIKIPYPPLHRPLYIMFLKIKEDINLLKEITEFCKNKRIKIYKWIPDKKSFKALLIFGFPEATGKEAELTIDFYFELKKEFGNTFKIGLSSGKVFAGIIGAKNFKEFGILGDRVNIASRLCDLSNEGQILFTKETSQLLPPVFKFIDYGKIKLKGKRKSPEILSISEKREEYAFEFEKEIIGRDKEIKEMMNKLKEGKSIIIKGEAGIGKSRILYEVRKKVKGEILDIQIKPNPLPLEFFKELLKNYPLNEFEKLKLFMEGKVSYTKKEILSELNKILSIKNDIKVFIEDIHWIDPSSLIFLKEMKKTPFIFIATSRPEGFERLKGIEFELIELKPLSEEFQEKLIRNILKAKPDKKFKRFLIERAHGNPFYIEQFLIELKKRNLIVKRNGNCFLKAEIKDVPFGIHSLLLSRLERIREKERRIIEIGACIGNEFELNTIKKIDKGAKSKLQVSLKEKILIKNNGTYSFTHSLFRETILSSLLERKRKKYHLLIAEAFIKENRDPYEIAYHLTEGEDVKRAIAYWWEVAENLLSQGLKEEMESLFEYLKRHKNKKVYNIYKFLQTKYFIRKGEYEKAERILKELVKIRDLKNTILLSLSDLYDFWGKYEKMRKVLEKIKYKELYGKLKLFYLEEWGIYYDMINKNKKAIQYYKKTLNLGKRMKDMRAISVNLFNIGWVYFKIAEYEKAEKYLRKSLEMTLEGYVFDEATCYLRLGQIYTIKKEFEKAYIYLQKALEGFRKTGFYYWEEIALSSLADFYTAKKDYKNAIKYAKMADRIKEKLKYKRDCELRVYLYFGKFKEFEKKIKGKEKEFLFLYYIYLHGKGKKDKAEELKREYPDVICVNKRLLNKKLPSLHALNLYKKYVKEKP